MTNDDRPSRTPEQRDGETTLMIWNFPKGLKTRFKMTCLKRDLSMRQAVMDLITSFCSATAPKETPGKRVLRHSKTVHAAKR